MANNINMNREINKEYNSSEIEAEDKTEDESGDESEDESENASESESDSSSESESDSSSEGESDSSSEGESDSSSEGESDSSSEGESDSSSEGESDSTSEGESENESEGESEGTSEGESESSSESDSENESGEETEAESDPEQDGEPETETSAVPDVEAPQDIELIDPLLNEPKAYTEGKIIIDDIEYWCYSNGEAAIRNGKKAKGDVVIPREIIGLGDETYLVTSIETYLESGREKGAFQGSSITGLSFEENSELRSIGNYAFSTCYGLSGTSVTIPDSVTEIGIDAFYLFYEDEGLAELRHKHVAHVEGMLPSLEPETLLEVPDAAQNYESAVNSSQDYTILHKAAKWTNAELTEAEIRIDYGDAQGKNGALDFVFVLDYSNSMLAPAAATDRDGNDYMYPRSLLTNDIVYGVSDIILDSAPDGYDNRIAMVAFGSGSYPLWESDFTNDAAAVEEELFQNPLTLSNATNYSVGLKGAINLINARDDKTRKPVVIFLSDGAPNSGYGKEEAKTLREMGVKVYPIAIYMDINSDLTNISYDGKTAYNAKDSESFQTIIMDVIDDIVQDEIPLDIVLEDVLTEQFAMATGTSADVTISKEGGSVEIHDGTLAWDLTGCAPGIVHNILIKVKLQEGTELTATGRLPTNQSMGAIDDSIVSDSQPELFRHLIHHTFENGTEPGQPLPDEVMELLPKSAGGFRDGTLVSASTLSATEVELDNGDRWEFVKWAPDQATINGEDVTFTGIWRRAVVDFVFTKTDSSGDELAGVLFDLYIWRGESAALDANAYISEENIGSNKWQKTNNSPVMSNESGTVTLTFREPGIYQLVETSALEGFGLPEVQWRFEIDETYTMPEPVTIPKHDAVTTSDIEKITVGGTDVRTLVNYRMAELSFIKISGDPYQEGQTSSAALDGAEFELYLWAAAGAPSATDLVTAESLQQGLWKSVGSATSKNGGNVSFIIQAEPGRLYQLVETRTPNTHSLPDGQWRIAFTAEGNLDEEMVKAIPGISGKYPPNLIKMESGPFTGSWILSNTPLYLLPETGGIGTWPFTAAGMLLMFLAILLIGVKTRYRAASSV